MSDNPRKRVVVFGGGSYGTALAFKLALNSHDVVLLTRNVESAKIINETRKNGKYLSSANYTLPKNVRAVSEPEEALMGVDFIVHVVPVQFSRDYLKQLAPLIPPHIPIVSASKGLCTTTLILTLVSEYMSQIIPDALGREPPMAFLSGPSFAKELIENMPTLVVVASQDANLAEQVQQLFQNPTLRVYTSDDVIGVEVGGALKNVIAIENEGRRYNGCVAAGVVEGLGLGLNSTAGLVTRGASELMRLAVAMGARATTIAGLSGMGDMMLTCFGHLSRNRSVGIRLGKGETIDKIIASMEEVAEGVATTPAAVMLAKQLSLNLPLVFAVGALVSGELTAKEAMHRVLHLPVGAETPAVLASQYAPRDFSIVKASKEDAKAMLKLIGHVYVEYEWIWLPKEECPDLINFDERYNNDKGCFWVAKERGQVVGGVGADLPEPHLAEAHRLYVSKHARRHGLGRKLMQTVLEWAKEKGCTKMRVWSDMKLTMSHPLYESFGFKKFGERNLNDVNNASEYGFELDLS